MAMKKKAIPPKKTANDDAVIYKVMFAMGFVCIAILGLQWVSRYYRMTQHLFQIRAVLIWLFVLFGIAAVACLTVYLLRKDRSAFWQMVGVPLFLFTTTLFISCAVLYFTWVSYVAELYALYIAVFVLYLIGLLYQREFLLLSIVNLCAGFVFFTLRRLYGDQVVFTTKVLVLNILLVLVVAAAASMMFYAGKHDGKLPLPGKRKLMLASHNVSPILLYVSCVVWLVCLIVSAFLGSLFAYYSMFAVAAFELAAAVYYTIKLS